MNILEKLEHQLTDTKAERDFGLACRRLAENPDFITVVRKGFMGSEAARFVQQSIDIDNYPATPDGNAQRADCLGFAQASGYFKRWFNMQITKGDAAASQIVAIENAIDEERAAEAND